MSEAKNEVQPKASLERVVRRLQCWWFGCVVSYGDGVGFCDEEGRFQHIVTECKRCGAQDVDYESLSGYTRHRRFQGWLRYWLYRKWWPEKCYDCKKRYGNHKDCLPF